MNILPKNQLVVRSSRPKDKKTQKLVDGAQMFTSKNCYSFIKYRLYRERYL